MVTLCNVEVSKKSSNCHKVWTWVLLNTLLQFHRFFLTLSIFVVFYNMNTVRLEMWVWGFPNHSCQKFLTNHLSLTRDLTRFLAFVIWKTPYSNFLLTVFSHFLQCNERTLTVAVGHSVRIILQSFFTSLGSCEFNLQRDTIPMVSKSSECRLFFIWHSI